MKPAAVVRPAAVVKYAAVVRLSARHTLGARGELIARGVFYVIILLVFSRLWRVLGDGAVPGLTAVDFIWYIALTEWVTLGTPLFYTSIEEDVRRGDIAYRLARPASYLWMKIAEGLGEVWVRLAVLGLIGFVTAWIVAGALPADPRSLLLAIPLAVLSCAALILLQVAIGLSVFWLQEAQPTFWIYQKLQFVFGGLFWPLEIYPDWMRSIAECTPFSPMVYGVGRTVLRFDPVTAALTGLKIVGWGLAIYVFVAWLFRKSLRIVNVNGG